ncbi:peptidase S1 [Burkholderia ubonensis]|uniref:Peptidase S1 n=3 Tax=Burkholderia ubonensis TaxID=101571 RepID=A0A103C004_9BURK|nr:MULTISPECIES: peptidase S1 [Burkholderia]AJX17665.1 serine carboxypeptidase family protein [Burkholderia ubonensis MSMB22]KIP19519.1 serine carboxypeptidase family protein [Burkholderia sp. MSHR3999]KVA71876.1 peptidase S1 [Burkholderia ubonensis]KVC90304.1 peptidase S1 [Burkholderia ubonensis]KVC99942.1 peptidase S1 [Burkholderia ubonensis]
MTTLKSLKDGFALFGTTLSGPLVAATAAALLVTGCGGDDGASPSAAAAAAATAANTPASGAATNAAPADQPFVDTDVYGTGPNDAVTDATEGAAVVHRQVSIGGKVVKYTATAGHLTTIDPVTSQPNAKMFYVAYTQDNPDPSKPRPVTFFYNGGPGSSSVYLLLGSFGPKRLQSSFPNFTPPAPYKLLDNPDSLLDRSDLVFINPVGTGYSAAIAPAKNKDFWGVDQDARSIDRFIQRYLTKYSRWNSPKFLFGESYGTARSAVVSWALHEDGIELNGITLQSSILDYANALSAVGTFPTLAADAFYWKKSTVTPTPTDLDAYMVQARNYADNVLAPIAQAPNPQDGGFVNVRLNLNLQTAQQMGSYIGTDPVSLIQTFGNPAALGNVPSSNDNPPYTFFLTLVPGIQIGQYDGRANYTGKGIAPYILPNSGGNDPSINNIGGAYTVLWNSYLNTDLKYTSTSSFVDLNDQVFNNWDFSHTDPTGANRGGGNTLYTAGDLASSMSLNPDLKVLSANGYFDAVTPFHQTELTLAQMPLDPTIKAQNLTIKNYPSGHMIYLNDASRTALKGDLGNFYDGILANRAALQRVQKLQMRAQQLRQQKLEQQQQLH